jgi:hypothetical protein
MIGGRDDNPIPAQILNIFVRSGQVAMAVRRYLPLSQLHAQYDYYRQFELQFAGILYYARQSDVEVVSVDRLLFHFAKTPFVDRTIGEHIHVLPLAKVSNCPYCP